MIHAITRTLAEWFCTCGRYGVFITRAERDAFTECPHANAIANASRS